MFFSHNSFLYTPRHDTRIFVPTEKLAFISRVGFLNGKTSICGGAGPQCFSTNLAYLDFDEDYKKMRLASNQSNSKIK